MPPRRGVRRNAGGRVATAEASSVLARGARGDFEDKHKDKHQEHVQYIEGIIQGLKDKVVTKCNCIMDEQSHSTDALFRARARAKSSIPKQFREMNLAEYCSNYGEDYDAILFHALPPKEREALLAKAGGGGDGDEEGDEEDEENNPGTTVKGRPPRVVPQTPSGTGKPRGGRVTRSVQKFRPVALPSTGARPPRAVPSTPSGSDKPLNGRVMRSAIKAKAGGYEAPTPAIESKDEPELPADVIAELRKRANPKHTVYEHLDAIIQSRIDGVPLKAAERCEQLKRKLEEGSAILRATVPGVASGGAASSGKRRRGGTRQTSPPVEGVNMEGGAGEEEEEEVVVGGSAKVKVSTEGGPYNSCVFELSLEEEGEARMVGRSTGKKFKQKGISLSKDSEVSISHGKFENAGGKVTFTDVGSTNGTDVDGEPAEPGHAYEIVTGSKLLIGQGICTVVVSWER